MTKFQKYLMVLASSFSISAFAGTTDVKPAYLAHGSHYVRVTKVNDNVSFDECVYANVQNPCPAPRPLGKNRYYTLEQLRSQRTIESWQAVGAVAGDVAIVFAGIYVGTAAGFGVASLVGFPTSGFEAIGTTAIFGLPGAALFTTGAGFAIKWVDALNPATQIRQAGAIAEDVILDREVRSADIAKFIKRLELVLDKI